MRIPTIRTGFVPFKCNFEPPEWKFEPFQQDSNHLNVNLTTQMQISTIRMQIRAIIVHLARTSQGRRVAAVAEVSKTSEAKVQLLADEAGLFKLPRRKASEPADENWLERELP